MSPRDGNRAKRSFSCRLWEHFIEDTSRSSRSLAPTLTSSSSAPSGVLPGVLRSLLSTSETREGRFVSAAASSSKRSLSRSEARSFNCSWRTLVLVSSLGELILRETESGGLELASAESRSSNATIRPYRRFESGSGGGRGDGVQRDSAARQGVCLTTVGESLCLGYVWRIAMNAVIMIERRMVPQKAG